LFKAKDTWFKDDINYRGTITHLFVCPRQPESGSLRCCDKKFFGHSCVNSKRTNFHF
jgi:hypothetical protein